MIKLIENFKNFLYIKKKKNLFFFFWVEELVVLIRIYEYENSI